MFWRNAILVPQIALFISAQFFDPASGTVKVGSLDSVGLLVMQPQTLHWTDNIIQLANYKFQIQTSQDQTDTKAWYVKTFGAKGGMRGRFEAADLPGVNLSFSLSETPVVGTKGRALDHIGFEVKDLEAFCKKLEASGIKFDVAYRKVPALGISIAFFTDPFGTYIELTEGLSKL